MAWSTFTSSDARLVLWTLGTDIVTIDEHVPTPYPNRYVLELWDAAALRRLGVLGGWTPREAPERVAFAAGGEYVAATRDRRFVVWHVPSRRTVSEGQAPSTLHAVALSDDGRRLALRTSDALLLRESAGGPLFERALPPAAPKPSSTSSSPTTAVEPRVGFVDGGRRVFTTGGVNAPPPPGGPGGCVDYRSWDVGGRGSALERRLETPAPPSPQASTPFNAGGGFSSDGRVAAIATPRGLRIRHFEAEPPERRREHALPYRIANAIEA